MVSSLCFALKFLNHYNKKFTKFIHLAACFHELFVEHRSDFCKTRSSIFEGRPGVLSAVFLIEADLL